MSETDYTYREAFEDDLPAIAELFRRHNYGPAKEDWLRWKFLDNPDGAARLYVAEGPDKSIVSFIAHLPRLFAGGKASHFKIIQSVDNFSGEEVRGKGVYSNMCKFVIEKQGNKMIIGFPNRLSLPHAYKSGWEVLARIEEWFFPVKLGKLLSGKPYGFFAPLVSALSRAYSFLWLGMGRKDICMRPMRRFEKDFEPDPTLIQGVRSAAYLNWRFIDNPMQDYSAYEFLDGEESLGYCVYLLRDSTLELSDFIATRHPRNCLRLLIDDCRKQGVSHLSYPGVHLRMAKFGFVWRGSVSYLTGCDVPEGQWMLTHCDRDV